MHRLAALLLVVPAAFVAGCTHSYGGDTPPASGEPKSTPTLPAPSTTTSGTFAPYMSGATAVTYDPALVKSGSTATVRVVRATATTNVELTVSGLLPRRAYGAHLHVDPCGPTGEAAGPHYQNRQDPAATPSKPSVDPAYANPRNEVWLDFTTDAAGKASATSTHPWTFRANPRSLIIHAMTTETAPGKAGMAGARVACLTLPA